MLAVVSATIAVVAICAGVIVKESPSGSGRTATALKLNPLPTGPKTPSATQKPQSTGGKRRTAAVKPKPTAAASTSTATATPNLQPTVPAGWNLTFSSDFSGSALDTSVWATCYYYASSSGCTNFGNTSDQEKEWYLPSQVQVSGGALHLVAKQESTAGTTQSGQPETYTCRSGMVTTNPGFNFEYGLVQIVARIPYNTGLWPAIWLAASNHAWPPEIDILEHWHFDQEAKVYLHPLSGPRQGGPVPTPGNLSEGWHTFTLSWTATRLTWWFDGEEVFTTTTNVPQQSMYLIMNLADDSTAAGACTGTMDVQSVKVWQPAS